MLQTYTKKELQKGFALAYATSKGHNKTAFKFALQLLANTKVSSDTRFEVRQNATETAFNIGDVTECLVKHYFTHDNALRYALATENDLERARMNEIKTFSNANRYPNGFEKPQGFIAVSEYGIHYITKAMVEKYWLQFRDYKGIQKQPTKAILKSIIQNEQPRLLKGLTEYMGLTE